MSTAISPPCRKSFLACSLEAIRASGDHSSQAPHDRYARERHGQECCYSAAPTSTGSKFGSGYCSSWMPSIGFLMSVPFVCKSNLRNLIFNAEVRRNSRQCPHKKAWISAENYFLPHWVALGDSWGHLGAGFRQWPKTRVRWCPLSRAPPIWESAKPETHPGEFD
jgi:hypothetical protein